MIKKTVLITGASGEIAGNLSELLKKDYNIRFLTRKKTKENEFEWDIEKQKVDEKAFTGINYIVHLAGAGIADEKWTDDRKKVILSSRVNSSQLILNSLKRLGIILDAFISASAVGFYGTYTSDKIFTEEDEKGNDFLSMVCYEWEKSADEFLNAGIANRVVKIRTGVVLSENKKGVLERIKTPVKYYVGAYLGSGNQYMAWIHLDDLSGIYKYAIENENMQGTYNAVAPDFTTNKDITRIVAKTIGKPLILPNLPGSLLKLFFGEVSALLLEGSRISAEKIKKTGYDFKFPTIEKAVKNLLL